MSITQFPARARFLELGTRDYIGGFLGFLGFLRVLKVLRVIGDYKTLVPSSNFVVEIEIFRSKLG